MLNYTQSKPATLNNISPEIFQLILSFLTPVEQQDLRLICKTWKFTIDSDMFDVFYMPFLNRLKKLDPSISVIAPHPTDPAHTHWIKNRFLEAFNKIVMAQIEEI